MDSSEKLLSARLLSLLKNGQWEQSDIIELFKALVEQFKGRKEDFHKWMMKIIYQVEIHKIKMLDLKLNGGIVGDVEDRTNEIAESTNEKSLDEILREVEEQAIIDKDTLAEVKDIVSSVSKCLSDPSEPHLQGIKHKLFQLCNAVEKTMNFKPWLTQMVSWCILVLSKSSRLVQVGTGEGKSCIVAMFAAYKAMEGKTPDIISSSSVLGERDAREWLAFYNELNITVDVNTNKSENELKKCYECKVVYGTAQSFAGDFLRQRFQRKDVRPEREFQCVIVDEVDSLMLDKGLEVVYLETTMPLMEFLNRTLAQIWLIIKQLKHLDTGEILGPVQRFSEIMNENENTGKGSVKNAAKLDKASVAETVAFLDTFEGNFCVFRIYQEGPDGTLRKLKEIGPTDTNRRQEMSVLLLGDGKCRLVHCNEDSLVQSLSKAVKKCFSFKSNKQNESCIPGIKDLINSKVQIWIKNALLATKMTLGHEYILHDDGVVPVDYKCTGVVQNDMRWCEGLQQFLEMKHKTKLSNMSLITNFMSNVGLFLKYNDQIFGITGTLGDKTELDMLKELYNGMTTCKIPSFKIRKLYELEGLVIPEEDEWIRKVCAVVKHQVSPTVYRGPRAALVICETINHAEMFHKTLAKSIVEEKLKLYVNNNMNNSTVTDPYVQEGDVIIATNLAGRGTDLKVCENVNEAGGLFVVQTFLPLNIRVEQQAFGRTARQGSPGSAQLIMCTGHFSKSVKLVMSLNSSLHSLLSRLYSLTQTLMSQLSISMSHGFTESQFEEAVFRYLENRSHQTHNEMILALTGLLTKSTQSLESNLKKAKDARNILVNVRLSGFLEKDIPKIKEKEELFSIYLDVLDQIYKDDVFSEQRDVIVSSLHECWGLWLLVNFSEEKPSEMLKEQLKVALSSAKQKLLSKQSPSSMVYYYIRSGNLLRKKGHLVESIEMYTKSLEKDASGDIIPFYNRALATIIKKDAGYITQALADLEKADEAIVLYKLHLALLHRFVNLSNHESSTEGSILLARQFRVKCMIVDQLRRNIQEAIMKLKRAESRGGNVILKEKHAVFLAEDFVKTAITHRDTNLPEMFALFVIEDIIKKAEIRPGDSLTEKFVLHCSKNASESRRGDPNLIERLTFQPLKDCIQSSQKVLVELLIEYEYTVSLGLETIFFLDTTFSLGGFISRMFRL